MQTDAHRITALRQKCNVEYLHAMTTALIEAHRSGRRAFLTDVGRKNGLEIEGPLLFSKLILLYHPDRLQSYLKTILDIEGGQRASLADMERVFSVDPSVERSIRVTVDGDDYEGADEEWEYGEEDFDSVRSAWFDNEVDPYGSDVGSDLDDLDDAEYDASEVGRTLFEAVQAREYGAHNVGLEPHHLDYFQGTMDLSDYEIDDLAGAEYLIHVRVLNLSANHIRSLRRLRGLVELEELYLAGNDIDDLSGIESLHNLRLLDLENNRLEDIEPLLNLRALEFVNLLGNRVDASQMKRLRERGVIVLADTLLLG